MPKRSKRGYARADRLNQQLLEVIGRAMLTEVRDPRARAVQITAVEVTSDLSHARVFFVPLTGDHRPEELSGMLDGLAGFMRHHVATQLQIKHVPQLTFRYDASIERGRRMEGLLDEALAHTSDEAENEEE